jgi:hypothetical protein
MGKPLAPLFIGARWCVPGPVALAQIEQANKSPPSFDGGLSSLLYAAVNQHLFTADSPFPRR